MRTLLIALLLMQSASAQLPANQAETNEWLQRRIKPITATNPVPASGATGVALTITLSWSARGATRYDVYLGTSTTPPKVATDITTPSYKPTNLLNGTKYYWFVIAKNSNGTVTSATWNFMTVGTVTAPPPTLTCPAPITTPTSIVTFANPVVTGGQSPIAIMCSPTSGSTFPIGMTNVTCTATDSLQRTGQCSFPVTVTQQTSTFNVGESNVLTTPDSGNANLLLGTTVNVPQSGVLQSYSFYVTTNAGSLRLGVYDAAGVKKDEALLTTTISGWNTAPAGIAGVCLPAGSYKLAYLPSSGLLGFRVANDVGATSFLGYPFGPMPGQFPTNGLTNTTARWSFYMTLAPATCSGTPPPPPPTTGTVSLAWDPPTTGPVTNYQVAWGTSLGSHPNVLNVGTVTTATVPNLPKGATYFFVVRAQNTTGSSGDSNEVIQAIP